MEQLGELQRADATHAAARRRLTVRIRGLGGCFLIRLHHRRLRIENAQTGLADVESDARLSLKRLILVTALVSGRDFEPAMRWRRRGQLRQRGTQISERVGVPGEWNEQNKDRNSEAHVHKTPSTCERSVSQPIGISTTAIPQLPPPL